MNVNVKELFEASKQLIEKGDFQSIDRVLPAVEACIESGVTEFANVKALVTDVLTYIERLQDGFFDGKKEAMRKDIEYSLATLEAEDEGYVSVVDRMIKETIK